MIFFLRPMLSFKKYPTKVTDAEKEKSRMALVNCKGWHARNWELGLDLDLNFAHFLDDLNSNRGDFAGFQTSSSKPNSTSDLSQAELGSPAAYTKFSGLARLEGSGWGYRTDPNSNLSRTQHVQTLAELFSSRGSARLSSIKFI